MNDGDCLIVLFLHFLVGAVVEKNPSEVLALLRGTIHESDRILRNWESEEPLPALFYYTYGTALYELGRLTEDEEFAPFLEAAEERLQDGFDHYKKDGEASQSNQEVLNKMDLTLGKIWLAKVEKPVKNARVIATNGCVLGCSICG